MKPDAEVKAIQDRVNRLLPRLVGDSPDRPVKVFVRRGEKEGSVLIQLSYNARGEEKDYEPGKQLTVSGDVALLKKWTDLVFEDFLAKAVKRLLTPEG